MVSSTCALVSLCLACVLVSHFRVAEGYIPDAYFEFGDTNYLCPSTGNLNANLICLGRAHKYTGNPNGSFFENSDGSFEGKLSLITEVDDDQQSPQPTSPDSDYPPGISGIAYYNKPVRLLDTSSSRSASFNTSFAFAARSTNAAENMSLDGMEFVVSANNSTLGAPNRRLGSFKGDDNKESDGQNSFKSIVVEFDNFWHWGPTFNDIGGTPVSFDFQNVTSTTSQCVHNLGIELGDTSTIYAWVEYSSETQLLELRINNTFHRPGKPFLFLKVDLFDVVHEYMWVEISGSTGDNHGNHYIWDWTFNCSFEPDLVLDHCASNTWIKVGIPTGAAVMILLVIIGAFFVKRHRRLSVQCYLVRPRNGDDLNDRFLQLACMAEGCRFPYKQLSVATGGFNERSILGRGGFGTVYRGVMPQSGTEVAVKKVKTESSRDHWEKAFVAEVSIITQLRHRNLIKLLGWCTDDPGGHFLIVYELMPNGSLDQVLFGQDVNHPALSWSQRFNIICGTAAGVDYLHRSWNQKVIHRDIKASNIMLDHEWNAKLGDFGLARLVDHQRTASTTAAAGTFGYMAPETASRLKFTEKTDVFAFGIVALEIVTGRKCMALDLPNEEVWLANWVLQRVIEGDVMSVVDRRLSDYDRPRVEAVLHIGLLCAQSDPSARPSMQQVVQMLARYAVVPQIKERESNPKASHAIAANASIADERGTGDKHPKWTLPSIHINDKFPSDPFRLIHEDFSNESKKGMKKLRVDEFDQLRIDVQGLGCKSFGEKFNPGKILCLYAINQFSYIVELIFFHNEGMASLVGIGVPHSKVLIDLKVKNHIVIEEILEHNWKSLWINSSDGCFFPLIFERRKNTTYTNSSSSSVAPSVLGISAEEAVSKFGVGMESTNHFMKQSASDENSGGVVETEWMSQLDKLVQERIQRTKILDDMQHVEASGEVFANDTSQSKSEEKTLVPLEISGMKMSSNDGSSIPNSKLQHTSAGAKVEDEEKLKVSIEPHKFLMIEVVMNYQECKFYNDRGAEKIHADNPIIEDCFIKPIMVVEFICDHTGSPDEEFVKKMNVGLKVDYQLNGKLDEDDKFGWYQNEFLLSFGCERGATLRETPKIVSQVINVDTEFTSTKGGSRSFTEGSSWDIKGKAGVRAIAQAGGTYTSTNGYIQNSQGSDQIVQRTHQSCLTDAPEFTISNKTAGDRMAHKVALRRELRPDFDMETMWNSGRRCTYESTGMFSTVNVHVEGSWLLHGKENRWHEFAAEKELRQYRQIQENLHEDDATSPVKRPSPKRHTKSNPAVPSSSEPTMESVPTMKKLMQTFLAFGKSDPAAHSSSEPTMEKFKQKINKKLLFNHSFSHLDLECRKRPKPYTWVLLDVPDNTKNPLPFLLQEEQNQ